MAKAKDLSFELTTLERRRAELFADVEASRREVDAARAGLVDGSVKVGSVASAQSKFSALSEALAALDTSITGKREQLAKAGAREAEAAKTERIAELRAECERQQKEYAATWSEADEAIEKYAGCLLDFRRRNAEVWRELDGLERPPSHTTYTFLLSERELRPDQPTIYGDALWTALQILSARLEGHRVRQHTGAALPPMKVGA